MNKTSLTVLIALLILVVANAITGCKKDDSPTVTEFTIKVDSVQHADTINAGDAFKIDFFGKIGDTDCYEFFKIENAFDVNLIEVKLIGKHTERDNCNNEVQYLNPGSINFNNIPVGDYTLRINQPEGLSPLDSEFVVK